MIRMAIISMFSPILLQKRRMAGIAAARAVKVLGNEMPKTISLKLMLI